jgi:hypothetical protein
MTKYEILQFDANKHIENGRFVDHAIERMRNDAIVKCELGFYFYISQYQVVASKKIHMSVEDGGLDEIFRLGQFVYSQAIYGLLHSISVGDVIRNADTQESYLVTHDGFERLGVKYEYHKMHQELDDKYKLDISERFKEYA